MDSSDDEEVSSVADIHESLVEDILGEGLCRMILLQMKKREMKSIRIKKNKTVVYLCFLSGPNLIFFS